jgi:hypothetical protein
MRIGLDLDNTLLSYDQAFLAVGKAEGLLPLDFAGGKAAVKARLLAERPDRRSWEALQGQVYGRRIDQAMLYPGVAEFLARCRAEAAALAIVSHKTVLAHHDPEGTNLHEAALAWLERQGFFSTPGFGLDPESVFFEPTREDKVRRVRTLGCDVFIDDLPDVLAHGELPRHCRKILFGTAPGTAPDGCERYASWHEITHALFSAP